VTVCICVIFIEACQIHSISSLSLEVFSAELFEKDIK